MSFLRKKASRGITFIGAVIIAVAFLIAIMLAISWILGSQRAYFTKPNMVTEEAEATGVENNTIWLKIKNYGISIATLKEIYVYDTEAGKYYIAYPNGTIIDPLKRVIVGKSVIKPLSASEGEYIYANLTFNTGILQGNLITGIAVFDKSLAPWKLYRIKPPISKPGYAVNAWRIKLFIYNPSDLTVFSDTPQNFLPGTAIKKPIAIILINKYAAFAGHFFNWTCGQALKYGITPGTNILFTDAYRRIELPYYRYYFNCSSMTAIFIVYLKNVTIFPRQTYPIYLWYAPWGVSSLNITDKSNITVFNMLLNESFQDLFNSEPSWTYSGNDLNPGISLIRDTTAVDMEFKDWLGYTYYLNSTSNESASVGTIYYYFDNGNFIAFNYRVASYYTYGSGDLEWDGKSAIYCDPGYANNVYYSYLGNYYSSWDTRCKLIYLNTDDGFFERFNLGSWTYYLYPEGYTWLLSIGFRQVNNTTPPNQTWIAGISPYLDYLKGYWRRRWWTGYWRGWTAKTFAALVGHNVGIYTNGTFYNYEWYFGAWWVADLFNDLDITYVNGIPYRFVWAGNQIEASVATNNSSILNFTTMSRFVYAYTSGADIVGSQFSWSGLFVEGDAINDTIVGVPPPPTRSTKGEVAGAFGDELIEGNTIGLLIIDNNWYTSTGIHFPSLKIDWIRVLIGLGYIWWEGPTLDQWPQT